MEHQEAEEPYITAKRVRAVPESVEPVSWLGVVLSAKEAASPYMMMNTTASTSPAYFSYWKTAFKPMKETTKPRIAAIATPSSDPILPSETAESASPPVMDPTELQPTCHDLSTIISRAVCHAGY